MYIPPFGEWINYIAHCRRESCRFEKDYKGLFTEIISDVVQRYDAYKLTRIFKGRIRHFLKEASIKDLIKKGKPYIDDSYKGDPVLSMGKVVEYVEHGYDGIINVIPFHCMPGTVVNGVLEKFQKDYYGIPCLKLSFDGQAQTNEETRLEAFMHQTYQRMEGRLHSKSRTSRSSSHTTKQTIQDKWLPATGNVSRELSCAYEEGMPEGCVALYGMMGGMDKRRLSVPACSLQRYECHRI